MDYLVTLNRRHFIDDSDVAARSGLCIGLPGDALAWVRESAVSSGTLSEFFRESPTGADLDLERDRGGTQGDAEGD